MLQTLAVRGHETPEEVLVFDEVALGGTGTLEFTPSTFEPSFCGGWIGWHCEGSILKSVFCMVMWDVIFAENVPDAFLTAYQDCPLDMDAPNGLFYFNR